MLNLQQKVDRNQSLKQSWKKSFQRLSAAKSQRVRLSKRWLPRTAASCLTQSDRRDETRKKANCFTLLRWLTRLKLSIQRSSRLFKFLPSQVFPQGLMSSCRADMSHTLAQNCHCELWSGAYPTCKKSPVHLTGMGVRSEGNFQCSFWLKIAEAFSSNKNRLRNPCRKWWTKNGVEVLGLSLFPCQKVIKTDSRYVTVISRDIRVS